MVSIEGLYNPSDFDWLAPEAEPEGHRQSFTMPATIEDGRRNDTLYRSGRSMKAKGWGDAAIATTIREENAQRCRAPLSADEVDQIIASVLSQADRQESSAAGETATTNGHRSPWDAARPVSEFVTGEDADVQYLDPLYSLVAGALTEWFSPRGLRKTHLLHALLVALTLDGLRVLLLDRDNPEREISCAARGMRATNA